MGKDNKVKKLHNKRRNAALLYEFLIRHISSCLVAGKNEDAKKALDLSKKYFVKGTSLHEELELSKNLLYTSVKSKESAHKLLNEILSLSKNINSKKLDIEKSNLIKEVNHTFGMNTVWNYKIPNYTVYASIYNLLIDNINKKSRLLPVDKIKFEDNIVEHLTKDNNNTDEFKVDPKYSNLVYKFIVERFHKKYENILTEKQKKFITEYSLYLISDNKEKFLNSIKKEVSEIKNKLSNIKDKTLLENKEIKGKISESLNKLNEFNFNDIKENNVIFLLKFIQLIEEVESQ